MSCIPHSVLQVPYEQRLKRLHLACLVSCVNKISHPILIELEFELERSQFGNIFAVQGLTIMPHVILI